MRSLEIIQNWLRLFGIANVHLYQQRSAANALMCMHAYTLCCVASWRSMVSPCHKYCSQAIATFNYPVTETNTVDKRGWERRGPQTIPMGLTILHSALWGYQFRKGPHNQILMFEPWRYFVPPRRCCLLGAFKVSWLSVEIFSHQARDIWLYLTVYCDLIWELGSHMINLFTISEIAYTSYSNLDLVIFIFIEKTLWNVAFNAINNVCPTIRC